MGEGMRPEFDAETPTLFAGFDRHVREARAAMSAVKDAELAVPWTLKSGGRVLMTMPRGTIVRTHINHLKPRRFAAA